MYRIAQGLCFSSFPHHSELLLFVLGLEYTPEITNPDSPCLLGTPFHFTLPKEGDIIQPLTSITPPLTGQLKMGPRRHSTPIGEFDPNGSLQFGTFYSRCGIIG